MSLLPDYSRQAERYDETRSASPSVLRALTEALAEAPGRRLADIGGGTGNYAPALRQEGWEPSVVDRSAEMLARAAAKGVETVQADAQELPFEDESFDAAVTRRSLARRRSVRCDPQERLPSRSDGAPLRALHSSVPARPHDQVRGPAIVPCRRRV